MSEFKCDKCGACCKIVGCDKLNDDNTCSIYETRPDCCRVDKMYELRKDRIKVSKEEYFILSKELCKILRKVIYG